jgi:pyridoxal phosphate enzyme (YggS family)
MNETILEKIKTLKANVSTCALKCGRRPEEITILYVTKTVDSKRILEAVEAGARDLGENRVQELLLKKAELETIQKDRGFRWHLIGHLQTNKAKLVAGEVALLHSLDSLELAQTIEKQVAAKIIQRVPCLIQVNSSGEATKYGLAPEEVEGFVKKLPGSGILIQGLMTIGPLTEDRDKIRTSFRTVRLLQVDLKRKLPQHGWDILSMGMSGDYEIAIEEGSTMIRVGTAIFGERKIERAD